MCEISQNAPPVRLCPRWIENPYGLVSWLDMLEFSASAFFWCGRLLEGIRTDCLAASAMYLNGEVGFAVAQRLDERAREKALNSIAHIEQQFRHIGLRIAAETVKELAEEIQHGPKSYQSFQWLMSQAQSIQRLAHKELEGKLFLYVPAEKARFWPTIKEPYAFGENVSKKFPSSTFDANSAGICLATIQATAAVFHLMCVLEVGLTALGAVFGVSLAHTHWAQAIDQIESKVREMHKDPTWKTLPDCKEQQTFYAQAASHFGILKDAWRNHTMHARGKYTENEAEQIFGNVRAFMQKLAERLSEIPQTP